MSKLHELLAAEKTPNAAWNQLFEDTLKKFGNPVNYFEGKTKSLKMLEESLANEALEDQAREERPVTTTVLDTLEYALDIYGKAEDLQYQKNCTNQIAKATVIFRDKEILTDVPIDELLGLESRLTKMRQLIAAVPTLDASKHWVKADAIGKNVWETKYPEESTKTEKHMTPVELSPATDKHPAQVQAVTKDIVVGKYTETKRSGAATAYQKAEAIKVIDDLLIACKTARMRANETEVVSGKISKVIIDILLEPFKD